MALQEDIELAAGIRQAISHCIYVQGRHIANAAHGGSDKPDTADQARQYLDRFLTGDVRQYVDSRLVGDGAPPWGEIYDRLSKWQREVEDRITQPVDGIGDPLQAIEDDLQDKLAQLKDPGASDPDVYIRYYKEESKLREQLKVIHDVKSARIDSFMWDAPKVAVSTQSVDAPELPPAEAVTPDQSRPQLLLVDQMLDEMKPPQQVTPPTQREPVAEAPVDAPTLPPAEIVTPPAGNDDGTSIGWQTKSLQIAGLSVGLPWVAGVVAVVVAVLAVGAGLGWFTSGGGRSAVLTQSSASSVPVSPLNYSVESIDAHGAHFGPTSFVRTVQSATSKGQFTINEKFSDGSRQSALNDYRGSTGLFQLTRTSVTVNGTSSTVRFDAPGVQLIGSFPLHLDETWRNTARGSISTGGFETETVSDRVVSQEKFSWSGGTIDLALISVNETVTDDTAQGRSVETVTGTEGYSSELWTVGFSQLRYVVTAPHQATQTWVTSYRLNGLQAAVTTPQNSGSSSFLPTAADAQARDFRIIDTGAAGLHIAGMPPSIASALTPSLVKGQMELLISNKLRPGQTATGTTQVLFTHLTFTTLTAANQAARGLLQGSPTIGYVNLTPTVTFAMQGQTVLDPLAVMREVSPTNGTRTRLILDSGKDLYLFEGGCTLQCPTTDDVVHHIRPNSFKPYFLEAQTPLVFNFGFAASDSALKFAQHFGLGF